MLPPLPDDVPNNVLPLTELEKEEDCKRIVVEKEAQSAGLECQNY